VRASLLAIVLYVGCGQPADDCPPLPYEGLPCTHVCVYGEGQTFDCVDGKQVPRCGTTNQVPCGDLSVADLTEPADLLESFDAGAD
jgi:hypothetical protein